MLFRLTEVLFSLTGVLFKLTGVLFKLTGVLFSVNFKKCFDCQSFRLYYKSLSGYPGCLAHQNAHNGGTSEVFSDINKV